MDQALLAIIGIAATITGVAAALITALIKERQKGIEREQAAADLLVKNKDEELARERQRTADAVADRKNMEQRLQFAMETMKDASGVMQGAVDVAEKSVEVMERLEARLSRPATSKTRRSDRDE